MDTPLYSDVMIDIEALALRPGAAIIRLAAATFDPWTGMIGREFDTRVKAAPPFIMDLETYRWNVEHGNEVDHPEALAPAKAASVFIRWLDNAVPERRERVVWAWGADYDFPLLVPYIDLRGPDLESPWLYHQQRCARTIWKIAFPGQPSPPRPHDAIGDVRSTVANIADAYAVFAAGLKHPTACTVPRDGTTMSDAGSKNLGR